MSAWVRVDEDVVLDVLDALQFVIDSYERGEDAPASVRHAMASLGAVWSEYQRERSS